jgi:simple sugar transport system substrate-binding protein
MKTSRVLISMLVLATIFALVGCVAPTAAPAPAPAPQEEAVVQEEAPPAPATTQKTYKDLTVGYAQLGAESEWRNANTASIK